MRIAILNWRDLEQPEAGGAEVFVREIGARWVARGHDVTQYTSSVASLPEGDERDGVRIIRIGRLRDGTHHALAPRAVIRDRVDVALESINTIPYMLPLRRRTPPFLPLVHQMAKEIWKEHLPRPLATTARWLEPRLYRPYRKTLMAAVSRSTRADLVSAGVRRVVVIPQGGIGEQPKRPKEKSPTLLFVGRLAANKRPEHAVEAFSLIRRALPEGRLWVVGDGPMRQPLEKRSVPGVEFLGHLPYDELLERMGRAHVLLVTSVREGWGLVVTEANACGTPAVAYDVPGLRDSVVHGSTGILTKPDPQSLAAACQDLFHSPVLTWEKLAARARDWGTSLTWDHTADVLLNEISSIAAIAPSSDTEG